MKMEDKQSTIRDTVEPDSQYNRAQRRKMNQIAKRFIRKHPDMSIQDLAETVAMIFKGEGLV